MKIFFIQRNNRIPVDGKQIAARIQEKYSLLKKIDIHFLTYSNKSAWKNVAVSKNDVIVLGLGHLFNPEYVEKEISPQIDFFIQKGAKVALVTAYHYFNRKQTYFDKDTDSIKIHELALKHRLPVLDVSSYLYSYFLRANSEELKKNLVRVKGLDGLYQFKPEINKQKFDNYIANWLYRKFFKQNNDQFMYGASLYPEVWNDEVNKTDIKNISEIGFNTVRIGEFFWSKLEPKEGQYQMDYLRNLLNRLHKADIKVILGIPSPTPPRWFTMHYPEARVIDKDGQVEEHGSRQHVCTNNLIFRKKVYELTYQIAEVVNEFDNVVAIQIDNEFKCHVDQCFCENCKKLWHRWLKEKYGEIDNLNRTWGTDIWSENYSNFDSVVMPTKTPFVHNTGLQNAFARFTADTLNDFASGIIQILIAKTKVELTHNTSMNFNLYNYELFNQLDIVGYDTYPKYNEYWNFPINLDLWRNLKDNTKFYLLETCVSHVGYIGNYVPPYPPKYLLTEIFLGFAAGLNAFMFWPYRAQPSGIEQVHGAVVTQAGTPDLGYGDVIKGSKILAKLKPILQKTHVKKSKVAIIYSDDSKLYMNVENGGIYRYRSIFTEFYEAITRRGISVEVIQPNEDFNKYDCVLAPFIRYVSDELLEKFRSFVNNGKKLMLGPMTGDRTIDGNWHKNINGLGKLGDWLGIKNVIQYLSNEEKTEAKIFINNKQDAFTGLVTLFTTEHLILDIVTSADVAGKRSIIYKNKNVIYLGGMPKNCMDSSLWDYLIDFEIRPFSNKTILKMSDGIYKYERENANCHYYFIANMSDYDGAIEIGKAGLLDENNQIVKSGQRKISAFSYEILRDRKKKM